MPNHRGIVVSVISQWEMKQFPEFPHPERAQSNFQDFKMSKDELGVQRPGSISTLSTSSISTSKADGGVDRESTVSCYIPSIPGIRFFLKYTVEPPYPQGQIFYFKLFMNGRHISSWGVNPRKNPRGQVLRGLFAPAEAFVVSHNSQSMLSQHGIESRPFLFTPEVSGRSAADDGGLIEVRTFRAKGRKRISPTLETFRPQEEYGLNLPTAGLLDKPQDTRYYDYILVDPKDEPYTTFRFHYRSWEYLQSLQLIPSSCPRALLKPSSSFVFLSPLSTASRIEENHEEEQSECNSDDEYWFAQKTFPHRVPHISQLHNAKAAHVAQYHSKCIGQHNQTRISRAGLPVSSFSVPQATLDEWSYDRPLPRLPKAKSSFDHSRNSSTSSSAPSVTPSLIPWLDRDSVSYSPEPIIGVAVKVPILRTPPVEDTVVDESSYSSVDWSPETPPQSQPVMAFSDPLTFSPEATFTLSHITTRISKRRSPCTIPAHGHVKRNSYSEDEILGFDDGDASPLLQKQNGSTDNN